MPYYRRPSSPRFPLRPLLAALAAVAVGSEIGGHFSFLLRSILPTVTVHYLSERLIDIWQPPFGRQLLLHWIGWAIAIPVLLFAIIDTLFFLGYVPFETPARSRGGRVDAARKSEESDPTTSAACPHLWLYECRHHQDKYLCFPPYCAPGGLRSRLFPSADSAHSEIETTEHEEQQEEDLFALHDPLYIPFPSHNKKSHVEEGSSASPPKLYRTTNSTNNPLDLILQSPYLPLVVKKALEGRRHDWNTLGGSACSYKRYSLSVAKELDLATWNAPEKGPSPSKQGQKSLGATSDRYSFRGLSSTAQRFASKAGQAALNLYETAPPLTSVFEVGAKKQGEEVLPQQQHTQHPALYRPTMTFDPTPPMSESAQVVDDDGASSDIAGKPIPQAVLVYHESAHSIVFRDHLRRQQTAIRRASTQLEGSQHGHDKHLYKQTTQPVADSAPPSRGPSTIAEETEEDVSESDVGYESGGSRGSSRSVRSGGESSSVASGGSRSLRRKRSGATKPLKPKASPPPTTVEPVAVAGFQPIIEPLEALELNSSSVFEPLLDAYPWKEGGEALEMTEAEKEVVELLKSERAVVKTVRNADWTAFLKKFTPSEEGGKGTHEHHPAHRTHHTTESKKDEVEYPFNSFVTSTSLLPSCAKKMRCFGSTNEYAVGVVFAMPKAFPEDASEDDAAKRTRTWSWPSGYSAKTEFNIDHHGNLINGREEALVPLSGMRKMNHAYLHDTDYIVGGRMVKGGLTTIPYNEVYIRVGGLGRIAGGVDAATGNRHDDEDGSGRSFDYGIGLPVALFVREASYGHLVRLLRTRARYSAIFGADAARGIPLLFITPEDGVRVFTEKLQHQVMKTMAWDLNPFQNPSLAYKTSIDSTSEPHLQQKLEELLDLGDDNMKKVLTPEEMARIAGGFGATDESVASLLSDAMQRDILDEKNKKSRSESHAMQDLVNEGLAFALRANDYHTSRQLLILYSLVAAKRHSISTSNPLLEGDEGYQSDTSKASSSSKKWREEEKNMEKGDKERHLFRDERSLGKQYVPPPPPPPPLDTDRLRSATNSDGLLAVLGAAQVLRAMQDGGAKRRVKESIDSIEEWIENGEQSVAFRVASWRDQRAAQGDLKIAMENDSNFMAFISNKAISNRKKFAQQLRDAAAVTDFDSLSFLKAIHAVCAQMHSPCLRLELLQYILGLDNRYSVAHVTRSVELAATCLNLSESDVFNDDESTALLK
ncbi:hypothetical protein ACHAXT_008701 [Thalassiosira profunda]